MRIQVAIVFGAFLAAVPAHAFGPGGLAYQFSSVTSHAGSADSLPRVSRISGQRYCAAFGDCRNGLSLATEASWQADRDAVMPLAHLALTQSEANLILSLMRQDMVPMFAPVEPLVPAGPGDSVLTGAIPRDGQPL